MDQERATRHGFHQGNIHLVLQLGRTDPEKHRKQEVCGYDPTLRRYPQGKPAWETLARQRQAPHLPLQDFNGVRDWHSQLDRQNLKELVKGARRPHYIRSVCQGSQRSSREHKPSQWLSQVGSRLEGLPSTLPFKRQQCKGWSRPACHYQTYCWAWKCSVPPYWWRCWWPRSRCWNSEGWGEENRWLWKMVRQPQPTIRCSKVRNHQASRWNLKSFTYEP